MENFSCSEDSFNAIYKCSCFKMLCPKHYFSHQENFPDHQIDRIKMNVNKESRQILTNLVITCKRKFIEEFNEVDLESYSREKFEKYQDWLASLNDIIYKLNLLLLFLAKTKYIFKKSFYTPFEYFLHQSTEKASKYARDFKLPEDIRKIFDFNYFKFEDKRYIFGFSYWPNYDNFELSSICINTIGCLFLCSEYEMAYETLQNLINIIEITDTEELGGFWVQLAKIVYNFIKKRNTIKLIKQWKKLEANLTKYYYFTFNEISKCLFEGLNERGLVLYLLEKLEIIKQDDDYSSLGLCDLGAWFFEYKNYKKAKKCFIKCIRKFRNSSNILDLYFVIISCSNLLLFYLHRRKNQRKVKKIVNIVNKIIQPFRKSGALDEPLLTFHMVMLDWDNAHKVAWKLIKLYEKNHMRSSKSLIYCLLAFIYWKMEDDKKCLQALANAKSCCGILSMKDDILYLIYELFGLFYLKNQQYKEAAYYYEQSINTQKDKLNFRFSILHVGMAHYKMGNYDRALQYFIEIEDDFLKIIDMHSYIVFLFYKWLGESYNCTNNKERASHYYCKAYEILNYIEYKGGFNEFDIFPYFFWDNKDYEKCKAILQIYSIWVEKSTDFAFQIMVFIYSYVLCKKQNKIGEANIYLEKAGKLMDLDNLSLIPKKQIYPDIASALLLMAYFYTYIEHDFFKAEIILIFLEPALDSSIPSHAWYLNLLYETLLYIYMEQNRQVEVNIYIQKHVNFLKLADQKEIWRENIGISEADIKENIRKYQYF